MANHATPCWKSFTNYTDACDAWFDWVRDGTLPETLRHRYTYNPPEQPLHDDLEIAGRHRSGTNMNSVTVHVQATTAIHPSVQLAPTTPVPIQMAPITPVPTTPVRSQRQPAPVTPTVSSVSSCQSPFVPRTQVSAARPFAANLPVNDDQPHWVVIAGRRPGVYEES